ncbi:MAG TPA: efflux RND transporter periplasmic adaptor subunit [Longimicrobiaceae bacterium]|nr:efflux RND transporter periplasmic adaptor subunit [Longimicrobiaceae bacterium]
MTDRSMPRRRRLLAALGLLPLILGACGGEESSAAEGEKAGAAKEAAADTVVQLDTAAQRLAGVELFTAAASGAGDLVANGTITYDGDHVSVIAPRAEGRIVSVRADLGQPVGAGTVLAVLESSDVGQTRGELERAAASVDVARRNYERERRLFEQSISSQKEMLEAEGAYRTAQADYRAAASQLRAVGATGGRGGTYGLATPLAGTVVERNASPGQVVGPSTNLFTVADLRHVWISGDVYEQDLARVHNGAAATVMPTSLPGVTFPGKVTYAGGVVDPASRTFKVRVEVENHDGRLRPGMFAQVRIAAPPSATAAVGPITIPEVAVQDLSGKSVVFVAAGAPGRYVARTVSLGPRSAGMVAVTGGLSAGERVAVKGAFQLKSELTKASFAGDD